MFKVVLNNWLQKVQEQASVFSLLRKSRAVLSKAQRHTQRHMVKVDFEFEFKCLPLKQITTVSKAARLDRILYPSYPILSDTPLVSVYAKQ